MVYRFCVLLLVLFPSIAFATPASKSVAPLFWQLDYKGKTSYAFGSIHLADKATYPLPQNVMKSFAASDALVVEIDLNQVSPQKMAAMSGKYGVDPKRPLNSYLTKDLAKEYDQYCQTKRLPCEQFSAFQPWFVSLTLMSLDFMASGLTADLGIDKYFLNQAKDKKPVIELETMEQQLSLFSSLPDKLQLELLAQSLQDNTQHIHALINSWHTGDEKSLIELFEQTSDEKLEQAFKEKMLFKRNRQMTTKLIELLKSGQKLFVVVGTAHFIGEQNILQLLEKQGVKVTKFAYQRPGPASNSK